jgi:membrane protein implicated in regulation of membrane protease activity
MGKSVRNYWVDVLMGLLALALGTSAFLLWVVLPQGYFGARLLWLSIHKWTGLALSVTVVLHLVLHWKWLVRMTRRALSHLYERDVASFQGRRADPDWM